MLASEPMPEMAIPASNKTSAICDARNHFELISTCVTGLLFTRTLLLTEITIPLNENNANIAVPIICSAVATNTVANIFVFINSKKATIDTPNVKLIGARNGAKWHVGRPC